MSAAEALAGAELRVSAETLRPLPGGSFYRHDLVGCLVETKQGARVGEVTSVEGDATGSRLVVRGRSGEILIPLAEGICVEVDVAAKKIVVDPPDGLMELNAPARQKF
jgi:16S rRNA processing protein RimM